MKKIINNACSKIMLLLFCMMAGIYTYAQDTTTSSQDTATGLTSADYHVQMPNHLDPFYNGPLRFIIMGVAIAVILYVSYRYWDANRMGKDIWHDPQ